MKKDEIFFGESGLTTTSSNHVANLCKEAYKALEQLLLAVTFYTTKVKLLGTAQGDILKEGQPSAFLEKIEGRLMRIAKLKSLIAWLREAIKAKDRLIAEAKAMSDSTIAAAMDLELPERPEELDRITEDDVIASWSIKKRNRYYYLDTICATIGQYIHPSGAFQSARESLIKVLSEPNELLGNGRDTIIKTFEPTVKLAEVETTMFTLQNKYREVQAELNSLKHEIEIVLQEDERTKLAQEQSEYSEYRAKMLEAQAKIKVFREQAIAKAQALKIVIPDSLKDIFTEVSQMGKE